MPSGDVGPTRAETPESGDEPRSTLREINALLTEALDRAKVVEHPVLAYAIEIALAELRQASDARDAAPAGGQVLPFPTSRLVATSDPGRRPGSEFNERPASFGIADLNK